MTSSSNAAAAVHLHPHIHLHGLHSSKHMSTSGGGIATSLADKARILLDLAESIVPLMPLEGRRLITAAQLKEFLDRAQLANPDESGSVAEGIIARENHHTLTPWSLAADAEQQEQQQQPQQQQDGGGPSSGGDRDGGGGDGGGGTGAGTSRDPDIFILGDDDGSETKAASAAASRGGVLGRAGGFNGDGAGAGGGGAAASASGGFDAAQAPPLPPSSTSSASSSSTSQDYARYATATQRGVGRRDCLSRSQFCHFLIMLGQDQEGGEDLLRHILERMHSTRVRGGEGATGGGRHIAERLLEIWADGGRLNDNDSLVRASCSLQLAEQAGDGDVRGAVGAGRGAGAGGAGGAGAGGGAGGGKAGVVRLPSFKTLQALRRKLDYDKRGGVDKKGATKALVAGFVLPKDMLVDRGPDAPPRSVVAGLARMLKVSTGAVYDRHWRRLIEGRRGEHGGGLSIYK